MHGRALKLLQAGTGAALMQALAGALCAVTPLCQVLGYEYAFVAALTAIASVPFVGLRAARRHGWAPVGLGWTLCAAVLSLVPGLVIILINGLRVPPCNVGLGLLLFALMPVGSALTGATMGWLIGALTAGASYAAGCAAVAGGLVTSLMLMLLRLYTEPPIVLFDSLWGYFAGSLYDENIGVPKALWAVRVTTLAMIAAAWCVARANSYPGAKTRATAWCAVLLLGFTSYVAEPRWGSRVNHRDIEAVLSTTAYRPGLVVHLPGDIDPREATLLADDHAYRYRTLGQRMQLAHAPTLHSYVYKDSAQKASLMGAAATMVAKPWLGELHIHGTDAPHPLLAHEMVHALAASWAPWPLRVSARFGLVPNMGMVEGLAVALADPGYGPDVITSARALYAMGLQLPLRQLLGRQGQFWGQAPARAYSQAGAFIGYVEAHHTMATVAALYRSADVEGTLGQTFEQLDEILAAHISAPHKPNEPSQAIARARMNMPSIFARTCAHEVARLRQAAAQMGGNTAAAWQHVVQLTHAPEDELALAWALENGGAEAGALQRMASLADDATLGQVLRAQAMLGLAQVSSMKDDADTAAAQRLCDAVLRLAPYHGVAREAWVTRWALGQAAGTRKKIIALLLGRTSQAAAAVFLHGLSGEPTAQYLLGRMLFAEKAYNEALVQFAAAGSQPYLAIEDERQRLAALAAFRLNQNQIAAGFLAQLAVRPGAYQAWATDFYQRVRAAP